jgi:hypothetical protein
MSSILKLTPGGVSSWTALGFTGSDFNSLANGSFVLASTAIDNSSNLDLFADASFIATVGGTTTAGAYLALWGLPLNRDGSTYGDTIGNGSTLPASSYLLSTCGVKVGVTSGNTIVGTFQRFALPNRRTFKFGISQHVGVAFHSTASVTAEFQTTNLNLNG